MPSIEGKDIIAEIGLRRDLMLDITAPLHGVQVQIDGRLGRMWVNVDGICMLRICQIPTDVEVRET